MPEDEFEKSIKSKHFRAFFQKMAKYNNEEMSKVLYATTSEGPQVQDGAQRVYYYVIPHYEMFDIDQTPEGSWKIVVNDQYAGAISIHAEEVSGDITEDITGCPARFARFRTESKANPPTTVIKALEGLTLDIVAKAYPILSNLRLY